MTQPEPMPDSALAIAERFYQICLTNRFELGFYGGVYFGDQVMLPGTPALCIEPGTLKQDLVSASNRTQNDIDTYFLVYHAPISEKQNARREAIAVAENLKRFLHRNHLRLYTAPATIGGLEQDLNRQLTVHGHCVETDPGYQFKQGTLYNAVQMTWRSLSKTWLQQP